MTMMLDNKTHLCPLPETLGKVLDVGTGTGIWAVDFADEHPEAEVVGTDLSPIQPSWVPPNLKFEVDDATLDWTFAPDSFDFVHMRNLFGSIADWHALYAQAFRATKPGGWIESKEPSVQMTADDGSIVPGMAIYDWGRLFADIGRKTGRSMEIIETGVIVDAIKAAGFVDVEVKKFKMPITGWAKEPNLRQIGTFNHFANEQALEGMYRFIERGPRGGDCIC
jgi:SAM-dependent methyltransferase